MVKGVAVTLAILVLALLAMVLLQSNNIAVSVNGQQLLGTAGLAAGGWGLLVAAVALSCVAILLAFVLAGVGLIVLGVLVLVGLLAAALLLPFLLPLLIPLFVVWMFVAVVRKVARSGG